MMLAFLAGTVNVLDIGNQHSSADNQTIQTHNTVSFVRCQTGQHPQQFNQATTAPLSTTRLEGLTERQAQLMRNHQSHRQGNNRTGSQSKDITRERLVPSVQPRQRAPLHLGRAQGNAVMMLRLASSAIAPQ